MLICWQGSTWTLLLAQFAEIRLQLQTQQCSDSMLAQLLAQCWYNAIEIRYHWIRNFLPLHLGDPCCFWSAVNSNSYGSLKLSKFCHCTCACAFKPKWSWALDNLKCVAREANFAKLVSDLMSLKCRFVCIMITRTLTHLR